MPFDKSRNFPDLGQRFIKGEKALRDAQRAASRQTVGGNGADSTPTPKALDGAQGAAAEYVSDGAGADVSTREDMDDEVDLSWSAVMKRTFEAYLRQERPNMYGEWMSWERGAAGDGDKADEQG